VANQPETISFVTDRKGHDWRYALTGKKLEALGWKPLTNLDDGLQHTFDWYSKNIV